MIRPVPGTNAIVKRVDCMGSSTYVAYEPSVGGYFSTSHYSITSHEGKVYGAVHCRRAPESIESIPPFSDARRAAFRAFQDANEAEAYRLIRLAFPEVGDYADYYALAAMTQDERNHHSRAVALGGEIFI